MRASVGKVDLVGVANGGLTSVAEINKSPNSGVNLTFRVPFTLAPLLESRFGEGSEDGVNPSKFQRHRYGLHPP